MIPRDSRLTRHPSCLTNGVHLIDEWMMTRLTADQRRDLMEVIDDRHDRAATILVSQIPVSGWFDQIGDPTTS